MRTVLAGAGRSTDALMASRPSLHLALRVLLLMLALGVTLGHGVDDGADKEAYHDDHNLLKEPRQPALLLPRTTERERKRERSLVSKLRATTTTPSPHTLFGPLLLMLNARWGSSSMCRRDRDQG